MRVELMPKAEADLAAIGDYIAADNPGRAVTFIDELLNSCLGLADIPRGFPLVQRYERHGIRRRNHDRYAIFYRIEGELIQVLHIVHGAQDYARILFPDG